MTRSLNRLYHALPLHYLPSVLAAGALYAQSVLMSPKTDDSQVPTGIFPRKTAARRDRMLGLSDYVHLSPQPAFPLLVDKVRAGYPHALLIFDGVAVLSLPEVSVLPYNTKAWRARAAYSPVIGIAERNGILKRYLTSKRFPSLEILVKYGLPLEALQSIGFIDDAERTMATKAMRIACRHYSVVVDPSLFYDGSIPYRTRNLKQIKDYFDLCESTGQVIAPPHIEFD